jgi:hypothetical protein
MQSAIYSFFSTWGFGFGALAVVLYLRWQLIGKILDNPQDRRHADCRARLTDGRFVGTYHSLLRVGFLDPLTRWIDDDDEYALPPDHRLRRWFGFFPWTPKSYAFCLSLAVFYPLGALLLVWLFAGAVRLGNWELAEAADWPSRQLVIAAMLLIYFVRRKEFLRPFPFPLPPLRHGIRARVRAISAVLPTVWHATIFASGIVGLVAMAHVGVNVGVGVGIVALCSAYVVAFPYRSGAVSVGVVIHFAGLFFALNAHPWYALNAPGGIDRDPLHDPIYLITGCVVVASLYMLRRTSNFGTRLVFWSGYSLTTLAGAAFAIWLLPPGAYSMTLLLFLAVLSILNAFWDWLSLGASRWLLGEIVLGRHKGVSPLLWGLFDLLLAVAFLLAIVLSIVAALALANRLSVAGGHPAPIDLATLFADLRSEPTASRHWWLYFMFLSTLVPTLIHFVAAGGAVMQWLAQSLRPWRESAARQMPHDVTDRLGAQLYLSLMPVLGIGVPVLLMVLSVWWLPKYAAGPARWVLDVAQSTAVALGGIPPAP